jgi:hypothetical protein
MAFVFMICWGLWVPQADDSWGVHRPPRRANSATAGTSTRRAPLGRGRRVPWTGLTEAIRGRSGEQANWGGEGEMTAKLAFGVVALFEVLAFCRFFAINPSLGNS